MRKVLKWLGIGFGGFIVLLFIIGMIAPAPDAGDSATNQAASPGGPSDAVAPTAMPIAATVTAPPSTPTPEPTPEPITFEGRGDYVTPVFDVSEGLLILVAQHSGSRRFAVSVLAESGSYEEDSIYTSGSYAGTRAHPVSSNGFLGLSPGPHRLEVKADGAWVIEVKQPRWDEGQPPPFDWSSEGDNVVGPILLQSGVTPVTLTHDGSERFTVTLMSADGSQDESLVYTTGEYSGSVAVRVHSDTGLSPGLYALVVRADGNWTTKFGE